MTNNFTLQDGSGLLALQDGSGLFTLQSASSDVVANADFNGISAVAPTATAAVDNGVIAHASFANVESSSISASVTITSSATFGDLLASSPEASASQLASASFSNVNASGITAVSIVSANATIKAIELTAPNAHAQSDVVAVASIAGLSLSAPSASVAAIPSVSFGGISVIPPTGTGHTDSVTAHASFAQITADNPTGSALIEYPLHKTIIRQYEDSPIINAIVTNYTQTIDARYLFDSFYTHIWNIDTANSQGLDIWGRIVGVSRYLTLTNQDYFGFDPDFDPFNESPFFNGSSITNTFILDNDDFRRVIKAKALNNISRTTIPGIDKVLDLLYGHRGVTYAKVTGDHELTYVFKFEPTDLDQAIASAPDLLPKPAGFTIINDFVF